MVDLLPKQLINQHDYHTMTQAKAHDAHDHDTYTNSYSAIKQQIRLDAMLSKQIQVKEQKYFEQHLKQVENKRSHEYQCNQMRDQIILDSPFPNRFNDDQKPGKHNCEERFENPKFTGFFQGQANLNAGRVADYYYNTHARVAFEDSLTNQAQEDETSLSNQRSQNYDQVPPPNPPPNILPTEIIKMLQPQNN